MRNETIVVWDEASGMYFTHTVKYERLNHWIYAPVDEDEELPEDE
jgi:hypothetical protein